ncbi:fimbrial protein [Rahnella selenatireducens]|uniref:fimbrial protein n=1 Tax=Rahnella selenatireducens TaxID=3389797 RepID=UPI00396925FA
MEELLHHSPRHDLFFRLFGRRELAIKIFLIVILLIFIAVRSACANMSVYPMEVTLNNQGAAQIQTLSQSGEAQFIKVSIKKIERPATPFEKEIAVNDAVSPSLIATPDKFALASGSQRIIRLISLNPPEKETAWRVYFEAVGVPDELKDKPGQDNKISNQVGINLVWGVLVHIPPQKPVLSLRQLTGSEVKNNGTVRVVIREVGICPEGSVSGGCQWKKEHATVYPDETLTFKSWAPAQLNSAHEIRIKYVDPNSNGLSEYAIENTVSMF